MRIQKVQVATGNSFEEVKKDMERMNEKYKITFYKYVTAAIYNLNDAEIEDMLQKNKDKKMRE